MEVKCVRCLLVSGCLCSDCIGAFTQLTGNSQQQTAVQPRQIQAKIGQKLQAAGFTDIRMMPSSFMVRARDKDTEAL